MGDTGSDDGDIVLEEVSQIYRCKDCMRCFISFSKFAEHFPVYHPDKVQITAGNQRSSKESPSENSKVSPGAAPAVSENTPQSQHSADYLNHDTVEKSTNYNAPIPIRKRKTPKRSGLHAHTSDSSDSQSSPSFSGSHSESALSGKDAASGVICVNPEEEAMHDDDPQSNKATNDGHEIDEQNIRKKRKTSIHSRENSHYHDIDEPSNHQNSSPEALNDSSIVIFNKETEHEKPREPMEVITLSDSDDDSVSGGIPPFANTINLSSNIVKIEVNESDPSENDIAPLQQPNDAPVKEGANANDNEKILEDKDNLSSSARQTKLLCKFCSKPFTRERTLRSHMRSIHRSEVEAHEEHQKKKDSDSMENFNGKDNSSPNRLNSGIGNVKRSKRKRKTKVNKTKTSDDIVTNISLGFTCKWCPKKFKLLEDLKSHAYNEHIKYKSVE